MPRTYNTHEIWLKNGHSWKLETESPNNRTFRMFYANGEPIEDIDIHEDDLQEIANLFNLANGDKIAREMTK